MTATLPTWSELLISEEFSQRLKGLENRAFPSQIWLAPEDSGIEAIARSWAARRFCKLGVSEAASLFDDTEPPKQETSEKPCGVCDSCRQIESGGHLGCYWLGPEDSKAIPIESIREFQRWTHLRSFEGQERFGFILHAHRMTESSQNALLKVFEEVPEKVQVILITSQLSRLVPTLRSRAVTVPWVPPQPREIETYLQKKGWAVDATQGLLRRMHRVGFHASWCRLPPDSVDHQDDDVEGLRKFLGWFELSRADLALQIADWVSSDGGRKQIRSLLDPIRFSFRDLWVSSAAREEAVESELAYPELNPLYQRLINQHSQDYWLMAYNGIPKLQAEEKASSQEQLAFEAWLTAQFLGSEGSLERIQDVRDR